jgi:tetratricopeptide (TPR) repeat protein
VATDASPVPAGRNRRLLLFVGLAAVAAAAAVVGATLLQTRGEHTTVPNAVTAARPGPPPLQLEFGTRSDPEARALFHAERLFDRDHQVARAAAIFRRYHSIEARLGLAFASWRGPSSLDAVKTLVATHPNDPVALVNLGWADYQAGRNADAAVVWRRAATRYPDSPYGVDAEDALHGGPQGLPPIVTGLALPKGLEHLPAAAQLAALKRAAAGRDARAKLLYGSFLWNALRMPVSAERELSAAAKLAPHDPVVRTAAAVGLFSKANPTPAFAQLGPLTAVFPHSAAVEFHLGVLLFYVGEYPKAAKHLRSALADGPRSPYAQYARTLLASLASTRSK